MHANLPQRENAITAELNQEHPVPVRCGTDGVVRRRGRSAGNIGVVLLPGLGKKAAETEALRCESYPVANSGRPGRRGGEQALRTPDSRRPGSAEGAG